MGAKKGLRLVQGMNAINEITTTLGNAVALGQAITAKGNNSDAQATILALLNYLAESNNANVANAAKAILIQATKSQEEMVAAFFAALKEVAATKDAPYGKSFPAAANDGLRFIQGMTDINEITSTLGNALAFGLAITGQKNNDGAQTASFVLLLNNLAESNNAALANVFKAILIQETKRETEMVAAVFAALKEAAASNDATLAAAANDSLRLVQGMNDINGIVTTLGNDIAAQAKKQPPSDSLTASLGIWNRLAKSNNVTAANAAIAIRFSGTGWTSGLQWA